MKRLLKWILIGACTAGLMGSFVSCTDYSSDIDNLQDQITALNTTVAGLQNQIEGGAIVKTVTQTDNGITITFSDGQSYQITNGENGTDADVWTIESDGYWYKNGVKSEYKAVGEQGPKGDQGDPGNPGDPGEDGHSYVLIPNYETGYFDLYEVTENGDGTHSYDVAEKDCIAITSSDDALTAVWEGNYLHLYNVYNAETGEYETYEIQLGSQLDGIAVVPSVLDKATGYPTTDAPFLNLLKYYTDEANTSGEQDHYTTSNGKWVAQYVYNTTTDVDGTETSTPKPFVNTTSKLVYRLNPGNAYVGEAVYEFINRTVKTRAAGDEQDLLEIVGTPVWSESEGTVTVTARLQDGAEVPEDPELALAALQVTVGAAELSDENVYTSDYIVVQGSEDADAVIVNAEESTATAVVPFHTRKKSLSYASLYDPETGATEGNAFVHGVIGTENKTAYTEMAEFVDIRIPYCDKNLNSVTTDLADYVNTAAIFNWDSSAGTYEYDYLPNCGVEVKYTYTLVDNYKINNGEEQQTWIELDGSVVSVPQGSLAVGKYPVVRVDATYTDEYGTEYLIASSYIQLQITGPELDDVVVDGGVFVHYRKLDDNYTGILTYDNAWIAENVFSVVGDDADFFDYYDNANLYTTVYVYDVVTDEDTKLGGTFTYSNLGARNSDHGLSWQTGSSLALGKNAKDEDAYLTIGTRNTVLTQHTYPGVYYTDPTDGITYEAAKYTVDVEFKSNDNTVSPNVIVRTVVYVTDDCVSFRLNDSYQIDPTGYDYEDLATGTVTALTSDDPAILVKGQVSGNAWELTTMPKEHFTTDYGIGVGQFATADHNKNGVDGVLNNVDVIRFDWAQDYTNVTPSYDGGQGRLINVGTTSVGISGALTAPYEVKGMNYFQVLVNGEYCPNIYYLVFINPFVGVTPTGLTLTDNAGENYAYGATQIAVVDAETGKVKVLTGASDSTSHYKYTLTTETTWGTLTYSVNFEIDKTSGDWAEIQKLIDATDVTLTCGTDGTICWENNGSRLQKTYTFNVIATVTFQGISEITFTIPVTLN